MSSQNHNHTHNPHRNRPGPAISPNNLAIYEHLKAHGAAGAQELLVKFQEPCMVGSDRLSVMRKKLNYLVTKGVLLGHGFGAQRVWVHHPDYVATSVCVRRCEPEHKPLDAAAETAAATKAPPRTYDVMRAPVWRTPLGPAQRPGATDFLQCPSRGNRC